MAHDNVFCVEDDLHSLVAYGGIDALVWLCQSATDPQLCHLATTILALLAEKGKSHVSFRTSFPRPF